MSVFDPKAPLPSPLADFRLAPEADIPIDAGGFCAEATDAVIVIARVAGIALVPLGPWLLDGSTRDHERNGRSSAAKHRAVWTDVISAIQPGSTQILGSPISPQGSIA